MPDADLTADLDEDEPRYPERMVGRIERLLKSGFFETEDARHDFEILLSMFQELSPKG